MALAIISSGQQYFTFNDNYTLTFDDSTGLQHLWIDTISNPNNIWQVGKPRKTFFSAAYSPPNVIVTDTENFYPPDDSSVFVIKNVIRNPSFLELKGRYYANTDSLSDYGRMEFSPDNGSTWMDMLRDSVLTDTINGQVMHWFLSYYSNEKPVLTGNSGGWTEFWINILFAGQMFEEDTVLFRFTFISDSIQTNKDGLMFDDLSFIASYEGIEEQRYEPIKSNCSPNPAQDRLTIKFENSKQSTFELQLFDLSGKVIGQEEVHSNQVNLPVKSLQKGLYFYKLTDRKNRKFSTGKFVKD